MLTVCVALYSFQPTILSILVQMSMCESFNFGSYLKVYLLESCDSTLYLSFYYDLVLPLLIIFSILLPGFLIIYISIKKYRGQLFDKEVMQKIGFIITGFKKQNFYWLVNNFCFFLNFFKGIHDFLSKNFLHFGDRLFQYSFCSAKGFGSFNSFISLFYCANYLPPIHNKIFELS